MTGINPLKTSAVTPNKVELKAKSTNPTIKADAGLVSKKMAAVKPAEKSKQTFVDFNELDPFRKPGNLTTMAIGEEGGGNKLPPMPKKLPIKQPTPVNPFPPRGGDITDAIGENGGDIELRPIKGPKPINPFPPRGGDITDAIGENGGDLELRPIKGPKPINPFPPRGGDITDAIGENGGDFELGRVQLKKEPTSAKGNRPTLGEGWYISNKNFTEGSDFTIPEEEETRYLTPDASGKLSKPIEESRFQIPLSTPHNVDPKNPNEKMPFIYNADPSEPKPEDWKLIDPTHPPQRMPENRVGDPSDTPPERDSSEIGLRRLNDEDYPPGVREFMDQQFEDFRKPLKTLEQEMKKLSKAEAEELYQQLLTTRQSMESANPITPSDYDFAKAKLMALHELLGKVGMPPQPGSQG